jgi:thiol-disulfide isomerase/thioredoxin
LYSQINISLGKKQFLLFLKCFSFIVFFLCSLHSFSAKLKEGTYRATLLLDEKNSVLLPFNFDVVYKNKKPNIIIRNADEKIIVNEIKIKGDSVIIKMPVFDTEFRCKFNGDSLQGKWINHYRTEKNVLDFNARYGDKERFYNKPQGSEINSDTKKSFEGKWELTFSQNTKDSTKAIGIFHHMEQTDFISGTILTETGDYRYLEGRKSGSKLELSCFDGVHAFLFVADYYQNYLKGVFYSGAHWYENWFGIENANFSLKNPEEITFLKNKDEKINFTYPDLNKKNISLNDKKFENKAVIIQVMGSWCPNCLDESLYLTEIYNQYKNQGLEIIALAFEKTTDFEKAKAQVNRLVKKCGITYSILLPLQTGKDKASESLNFVNKISAFPTTLFLNKQHKAVKIHTGFNGPATGNEYLKFKQSTESLITNLLKE